MPSTPARVHLPPSNTHRRSSIFFKILCVCVITAILVNIQLCLIQIYSSRYFFSFISGSSNNTNSTNQVPAEYLVYTSNCKLLSLNPFDKSALQYINQDPKLVCNKTTLVLSEQIIKLNSTWLSLPEKERPQCCFRRIERVNQDPTNYTSKADEQFSLSKLCYNVSLNSTGTQIPMNYEFIQTECQFKINNTKLLNVTKPQNEVPNSVNITNFYAIVYKPENHSNRTKEKVNFWKNYMKSQNDSHSKKSSNFNTSDPSSSSLNPKKLPPNVLIIGIDSVSRQQMIRTLPYTREFLFENDFIELKGYTRTGENTFPNMMAALGGMENEKYPCHPNKSAKLDGCPFIWKNFSSLNYVTAIAEDSASLAIFNYLRTGFVEAPVDYFLRPLATAYYKFHNVRGAVNYHECVQGVSVTQHLLQYMNSFVKVHERKVPYFYFTWIGGIAHSSFNALRDEDSAICDFFKGFLLKDSKKKIPKAEDEDNTVIFFISDHGSRLHPIRWNFQGYFEESVPFSFVRIPPSVKKSHPHWYENLKINSNRLTSPLDLHATLEDILSLAHSQLNLPEKTSTTRKCSDSLNTPNTSQKSDSMKFTHSNWEKHFRSVYSFFEETPENRSCESSKIPDMYCRCGIRTSTSSYSPLAKEFSLAIVEKVNKLLEAYISPKSNDCVKLKYREVSYTRELSSGVLDTTSNYSKFGYILVSSNSEGQNDTNQTNSHSHIVKANYTDFIVGVDVETSRAIFDAKIRLVEEVHRVNRTSSETKSKRFFKIVGDVNRVNLFRGQSDCVSDGKVTKYCYCSNLIPNTTTTAKTTTTVVTHTTATTAKSTTTTTTTAVTTSSKSTSTTSNTRTPKMSTL